MTETYIKRIASHNARTHDGMAPVTMPAFPFDIPPALPPLTRAAPSCLRDIDDDITEYAEQEGAQ